MKSPAIFRLSPLVLVLLWGCAGEPTLNMGQPGKSLTYGAGTPAFDLEAIPGPGGLEVLLSVPYSSVTFVRYGAQFRGQIQVSARLHDPATEALLTDVAWPESLDVLSYAETQSVEPFVVRRSLQAVPGDHILVVAVEDRSTGRIETRIQPVHIPDPLQGRPSVGRVVLISRNASGVLVPVIPFHIAAGLSGLRSSTRLYGLNGSSTAVVTTTLERFDLDQRAALPPQAFALVPGQQEPRRILFEDPDTIWNHRDTLHGPDAAPSQALDHLSTGLFRISVRVAVSGAGSGKDTTMTTTRVFSLKPPGFPKPTTLAELLEPLIYIATNQERKRLASVRDAQDGRALFDSLWLAFCPDRSTASALIRRFYTRVEEANRQYTDLKEGWKTDRGMLYIVMGPPTEIDNNLDRQIWYYTLPGTSQNGAFVLRKVVVGEGETSLLSYTLYRDAGYERLWEYATGRWRRCEGG